MTLSLSLVRPDDELIECFKKLASRKDIADLLEIPDNYLFRILYVRNDRLHYRKFQIKKRAGGTRTISAPTAALSVLQSKLNHVLQLIYAPKPCVHGFVLDRSILTNASPHVGKRWVLNVDIENFFPSINFGRVRGAFMARPFNLPKRAATVIAQICTADGILPQGAPTSPVLANFVCAKLDGDLMALARRFRLTYTRYCDDLTFSGRHHSFPPEVAVAAAGWIGDQVLLGPALEGLVSANGFRLNPAKTRLQLWTCHQEVTGLTVNAFPNLPRHYVRSVRGMLYA